MKVKVSEFECKFGMKQAFGCIDGTHKPILRPHKNSQEYYDYKNFLSLSVQAVCVCIQVLVKSAEKIKRLM